MLGEWSEAFREQTIVVKIFCALLLVISLAFLPTFTSIETLHKSRNKKILTFPNHSSFFIPHVMYLVKNYPSNLSHNFRTSVEHVPQNLRSHDETWCWRIDRDVTSDQTNIVEFFRKFPVLLVGKGFYRSGVYDSLLVLEWECYGIPVDRTLSI